MELQVVEGIMQDVIRGKPSEVCMKNAKFQGSVYKHRGDNREHVPVDLWWLLTLGAVNGFGVEMFKGLRQMLQAPPGAKIPQTFDFRSLAIQFLVTGGGITLFVL